MTETRISSTFRVVFEREPPTDPRKRLGTLAAITQRFHAQNERMALGLRIGFRELENRHGVNVLGSIKEAEQS